MPTFEELKRIVKKLQLKRLLLEEYEEPPYIECDDGKYCLECFDDGIAAKLGPYLICKQCRKKIFETE